MFTLGDMADQGAVGMRPVGPDEKDQIGARLAVHKDFENRRLAALHAPIGVGRSRDLKHRFAARRWHGKSGRRRLPATRQILGSCRH